MEHPRLLIVLAFCDKDKHLAKALLKHIKELGGCPKNDLLLISSELNAVDHNVPFAAVATVLPWCSLPDERHPIGPNIMFQTALKYVRRYPQPFLWLEPDAVPLRKDWLQEIEAEYVEALKAGKQILSCVTRGNWAEYPKAIPSGISIYPADAWKLFEGLNRKEAWDVQFADRMMPNVYESKRIHNRLNHTNAPHFVSGLKIKPNDMTVADIPKGAVLFHPCKDGSLTALLAKIIISTESLKERAMNETSKAMRRRNCEEADGGFKWSEIFSGIGVDVGAGNDPVQLPNCKPFDMHDGDANHLSRYVAHESLDYIHASQSLEHMHDPRAAILDWALCVKKGGYLVVSCPDFDCYEKCQWPSRFNPDHKSAWSTWRKKGPKGVPLVYVPDFCRDLKPHGLTCIKVELCCDRYDWNLPPDADQTLSPDGAEAFVEIVFQKDGK